MRRMRGDTQFAVPNLLYFCFTTVPNLLQLHAQDEGRHTVCVQVTEEFLAFSKQAGNDLSTPLQMYLFPGTTTQYLI